MQVLTMPLPWPLPAIWLVPISDLALGSILSSSMARKSSSITTSDVPSVKNLSVCDPSIVLHQSAIHVEGPETHDRCFTCLHSRSNSLSSCNRLVFVACPMLWVWFFRLVLSGSNQRMNLSNVIVIVIRNIRDATKFNITILKIKTQLTHDCRNVCLSITTSESCREQFFYELQHCPKSIARCQRYFNLAVSISSIVIQQFSVAFLRPARMPIWQPKPLWTTALKCFVWSI